MPKSPSTSNKKIKVAEATPVQLDWLVAKALYGDRLVHYRTWLETVNECWKGRDCSFAPPDEFRILSADYDGHTTEFLKNYSTNWAQGGPIIEREVPMMMKTNGGEWIAQGAYDRVKDCEARRYYGPTPLIAAMRCYVASKLGDEVEVPDELI